MNNANGNSYMLIFSNPVEGKEDEYNDWYTNVHLKEVVSRIDGIVSAQRFKLAEAQMNPGQPHKYAAIYEIEKGMEAAVLENLKKVGPTMNMMPVLDRKSMYSQLIESISDVVT